MIELKKENFQQEWKPDAEYFDSLSTVSDSEFFK